MSTKTGYCNCKHHNEYEPSLTPRPAVGATARYTPGALAVRPHRRGRRERRLAKLEAHRCRHLLGLWPLE